MVLVRCFTVLSDAVRCGVVRRRRVLYSAVRLPVHESCGVCTELSQYALYGACPSGIGMGKFVGVLLLPRRLALCFTSDVASSSASQLAPIFYEHSKKARAQYTGGPKDVPRWGALRLLQKPLYSRVRRNSSKPCECLVAESCISTYMSQFLPAHVVHEVS